MRLRSVRIPPLRSHSKYARLEVKISEAKNLVPADWIKINSTKQAYRYRSPSIQKRLEVLEQWRERVAAGKSRTHA